MIVGLFTSVMSVGGIQNAGRQTAAALSQIAEMQGLSCAFLSLNDPLGDHEISAAGANFHVRSFARDKPAFLMAALRLAMNKPKLVFAAHPHLGPVASFMKLIARDARLIVGAHGIEVWQPLSAFQRKVLRRADVVFAPSSDTVLKLATVQRVPQAKIRRLSWPIDAEFLELASNPCKLHLPSGFPTGSVILSVGRWSAKERYKGADLLIRAIARLRNEFADTQLVLVGPGDDIPRLKYEAVTNGVSAQVHFFTLVSRDELAACYAHCDIFALPSTGEGFGLVFLEAMAFGKPILGANIGGIPDVVEHECEALLVNPTMEAVSAALAQLIANPALRRDLGQRGKERIQKEFSFQRFQQRLIDALNETRRMTMLNESAAQ